MELPRDYEPADVQRLVHLAQGLGLQPADALNAVQTAYTRLLSAANVAELEAWLTRVVVNAARDAQRDVLRQRMRLDRLAATRCTPTTDPLMIVIAREEDAEIKSAVAALPKELREAWVMKEEDLSHVEIAAAVGVSTKTVGRRLKAAKRRLFDATRTLRM